jgi:sodium-dependent phosphate cotransporter
MRNRDSPILQLLFLVFILLVFFTSIELMGTSFKLMGRGVARTLIETTSNPFVGLFIGILATSLVQSSSTVTSMTVSIVAGGGLSISGAIPIIMGANIGTSVTNTIVSLGSITRRDEFRRAMAGATVHDFFNLLAVVVLFPLELIFHVVSWTAAQLTDALAGIGGTSLLSPLKAIIEPVADLVVELAGSNGWIVLGVGLVLLFVSLRYLVVLLKTLVLGRSEQLLHKYIFGAPLQALLFGALITLMVQSSSITTSITVPLVAAGIVTVAQIYPFVLGANIGTTITAILAGLSLSVAGDLAGVAALKVAFAHLVFNVYGILLFFPIPAMRNIPIRLAEKLGDLAAKSRAYAIGYVLTVFFIVPLLAIMLTRNVDLGYDPPLPDVLQEVSPVPSAGPAADSLQAAPQTDSVLPPPQ